MAPTPIEPLHDYGRVDVPQMVHVPAPPARPLQRMRAGFVEAHALVRFLIGLVILCVLLIVSVVSLYGAWKGAWWLKDVIDSAVK